MESTSGSESKGADRELKEVKEAKDGKESKDSKDSKEAAASVWIWKPVAPEGDWLACPSLRAAYVVRVRRLPGSGLRVHDYSHASAAVARALRPSQVDLLLGLLSLPAGTHSRCFAVCAV